VQKAALIPTRPGPLTLPEVRVDWWDTTAGVLRSARLPAQTVEVLPAAAAAAATPTPSAAPSDTPAAAATAPLPAALSPAPRPPQSPEPWRWISLFLLAGWGATVALWWREHRRNHPASTALTADTAVSLRVARAQLVQACRADDPSAARAALLAWAAAAWPARPPHSLPELARRLSEEPAREAVLALDRALYGDGRARWDGAELQRALHAILGSAARPRRSGPSREPLPQLYPQS
jgi:hypothetical protein